MIDGTGRREEGKIRGSVGGVKKYMTTGKGRRKEREERKEIGGEEGGEETQKSTHRIFPCCVFPYEGQAQGKREK